MSKGRPMIGEDQVPVIPRRLMWLLYLAVALGVVGTAASVVNGYATNAATKADVQRNGELTKQLTELTEQIQADQDTNAESAEAFRNDSRLVTVSTCDQVHAIAVRLGLNVKPCPVVRTPAPTPGPSPTP